MIIGPEAGFEHQIQRQPKEVFFCTRCVQSSQRPLLTFDAEGVCSACRYMEEYRKRNFWQAKGQLNKIMEQARKKNPTWQAVCPSSGGKDSTFVATTLAEMGVNVLCVTAAPFRRGEIGEHNYRALIAAGFHHLELHPNEKLHRKLARLSLELTGDAWDPFARLQMSLPHLVAGQFQIPYVIYGEHGQSFYSGSQETMSFKGMDVPHWKREYYKGADFDAMVRYGVDHSDYLSSSDFTEGDLAFYRPPPGRCKTKMLWMSEFVLWTPEECYYKAVQATGFRANPQRTLQTFTRFASLDDPVHDAWHYFFQRVKFGVGRATADASSEIRNGHLTRQEGVSLVHRYDGEFPGCYLQEFLDYLDISEDYFQHLVDVWRPRHLWEKEDGGKVDGEWKLKYEVSS